MGKSPKITPSGKNPKTKVKYPSILLDLSHYVKEKFTFFIKKITIKRKNSTNVR